MHGYRLQGRMVRVARMVRAAHAWCMQACMHAPQKLLGEFGPRLFQNKSSALRTARVPEGHDEQSLFDAAGVESLFGPRGHRRRRPRRDPLMNTWWVSLKTPSCTRHHHRVRPPSILTSIGRRDSIPRHRPLPAPSRRRLTAVARWLRGPRRRPAAGRGARRCHATGGAAAGRCAAPPTGHLGGRRPTGSPRAIEFVPKLGLGPGPSCACRRPRLRLDRLHIRLRIRGRRLFLLLLRLRFRYGASHGDARDRQGG